VHADDPLHVGLFERISLLPCLHKRRYDNNDLKFHSTTGAFSPDQFYEYLKGAFDTLLTEGEAA